MDPQNYFSIAWIHNDKANYSEALPFINKAIELNKEINLQFYKERIVSNKELKNVPAVIADYKKMLEKEQDGEFYYEIGYYQNDLKEVLSLGLFQVEKPDRLISKFSLWKKPAVQKHCMR